MSDVERILTKLDGIDSKVTQHGLDLTELRAEVMGRDGKGRLPALEVKVEANSTRLTALERFRWLLAGGSAVAIWVAEKFLHAADKAGK